MDRKPVVLVVDDQRATVRLLQINLDAEGYEVITALNGSQALERSIRHPPDLVILDLMLPGMDGYQLLAHLRRRAETADAVVIVLSARRDLEQIAEGWLHEIDLYLTKPYNIADLLSMIERLLQVRREERMLQPPSIADH